ncbi:MAG: hypothetical protein CR993_03930 [Rhodobacterales bacterium]|nr:MAG: hypothetical protein CR993_03930 [Rhodobacterales bacterium]
MKIAFHMGAHCTDEDQLLKTLLRNQDVLAQHGVGVPAPSRFRTLFRDAVQSLDGAAASAQMQQGLIDALRDHQDVTRLIFSRDNFICNAPKALEKGVLYQRAGNKSRALRNLFADHEVEFFFAMRNPATFLPALSGAMEPREFHDMMRGVVPENLLWSEMIRDIRTNNPDCPITVWCNEDTPLIWPEVLHTLAGIDARVPLQGELDIAASIMAPQGFARLESYLATHPPANPTHRHRVLAAFLDKYALDEAMEEEVDLPGWTPELVVQLSDIYDGDMQDVAEIPGVRLIEP